MNTEPDPCVTAAPKSSRRIATKIISILALLYVLLNILLIANETVLVYPGSKFPKGNWSPTNFEFEEIEFEASDSTKLVGWYLPGPAAPVIEREQPGIAGTDSCKLCETILLCHGNAENCAESAAYNGDLMRKTLNADVFVFDYRGYGKSQGTPSEAGVLDDAEQALKWVCQRTNKTPQEIVIVGHSLGGGPACYLASRFQCKALVLQRTFSSLADAAQYNYPMFPVRYLMQNQYHSAERIRNYSGPLFQSHGTKDKLIPLEHARRLFDNASTSDKQFYEIPGMGHYDGWPDEYWVRLKDFLERVL